MARRTRADAPPNRCDDADHGSPVGLRIGDCVVKGQVVATPAANEPHRPHVIVGDVWAWKAYRIVALRVAELLERVRREAEIALSVDAIDGVVGAVSVDEIDGWLVLRMRSMSGTLADHLTEREAAATRRLAPDTYAELLGDVGTTLARLHRRGIVHRDIKPANLLFRQDQQRLLICDFSVAKTRGSNLTRTGVALGTDSYIAPEQWRSGECTPASDQYSLGIVAREVFTGNEAPPLPRPLADVLHTASAADPDDRFPGVAGARDFGEALVRAVKAEAPATLADRMRRATPATRYVWAPTALATFCYWLYIVLKRDPDVLIPLETLVLPVLFGAAVFGVLRAINAPRARRSRSGWNLLDQWWLPGLIVATMYMPIRSQIHGAQFLVLLIVPAALARVGAFPPRTGYWLPSLLDRASRLGKRPRRIAGWRTRFASAAVVAALAAFIPSWVGQAWPAPWSGPTGLDSAALRAVSAHRQALLRGDLAAACSMVNHAVVRGRTRCARWAKLDAIASKKIRAQVRRSEPGRPLFDDITLGHIELRRSKGGSNGDRIYTLDLSSSSVAAKRRGFGVLIVRRSGDALIGITNGPAVSLDDFWRNRQRLYQVREVNGRSTIQASKLCTGTRRAVEGVRGRQCASPYRLAPAEVARLLGEA